MKKITFILMTLLLIGFSQIHGQISTPCGDSLHYVQIQMTTNIWASEMSWILLDNNALPINGGGPYSNNQAFELTMCVPAGCYTLHLHDSFGDGWNGGTMNFLVDGSVVFSGTMASGSDLVMPISINSMGCVSSIPLGCMDPAAYNFNPQAQMSDGSCLYAGCTDPTAMNYVATANLDDSSCVYCEGGAYAHLYICAFANGDQINLNLVDSNGVSIFTSPTIASGAIFNAQLCLDSTMCYTAIMTNTAGLLGWNNGYFWISVGGAQIINQALDVNLTTETANFSINGPCNFVPTPGCMDPFAINYNVAANTPDSSCLYPVYGCFDINALNYNANATVESNCIYANTCGTQNMIYFDWMGNVNLGYNNAYYLNDINGGYINYINEGTDTYACVNDGCYYIGYSGNSSGWNSDSLVVSVNQNMATALHLTPNGNYNGIYLISVNTENPCTWTIPGCTDPMSLNYNAMANVSDSSCIYNSDCAYGFSSIAGTTGYWANEMSFTVQNSAGDVVYSFQGEEANTNFVDYLCLAPDCYTVNMEDSWGDGWNGGNFMMYDNTSTNYFSGYLQWGSAAIGQFSVNGGCIEQIWGCTDSLALNYNPSATSNDGTCFYNDNNPQGWNPGMAPSAGWEAVFYPNPSMGNVNLQLSGVQPTDVVRYNIYSLEGQLIAKHQISNEDKSNNLTIKNFPSESGVYLIQIFVNDASQMYRVVRL